MKQRGATEGERRTRVAELLDLIKLPAVGQRYPAELSGGQRQRVAIARAVAYPPQILLMDEPLGALDLKLREQMQEELKALQRQLGVTFVFVTHDQGEALSMADRVAVFNDGRIMQVGTPAEIYQRPASRFVADFVGSSNVLPPDFVEKVAKVHRYASLRPENIRIVDKGGHAARLEARNFLGGQTRLLIDLAGLKIHALLPSSHPLPEDGSPIRIAWDKAHLHLMEQEL
jgi:putative spermidine/putrescine transport system ATP-binding protein